MGTLVDMYIKSIESPWMRANLELFRALVHETTSNVTEDIEWNVPVFIIDGKVQFAMSVFKQHTKYNFMKNGALLNDTAQLFNNGFESAKSRGIDLHEGETISRSDLRALIHISVSL